MTTKILVVEDERIVGFNLQQRLIKLGYQVPAIAVSAIQALSAAEKYHPDIVLMDIHIEGDMDGIQAAAEIGKHYKIPVIYLTAYSEEGTLARARETKPYGYLLKPFSERELHATIQMALERRLVEVALDESQTRLRMALSAADMTDWGLKTLETNGEVVYAKQANEILGYPEKDFCGSREDFIALVHPEDRESISLALDHSLSSNSICDIEFRTESSQNSQNSQASQRWLRLQGKVLPPAPDFPQLIGILQNITERKATEHRLRQASTVFDATHDGIVILNVNGHVIDCNNNFTAMTGYTLAEMLNSAVNFVEFNSLRIESLTMLEAVWRQGGKWRDEAKIMRKSADAFPALLSVSSVESEHHGLSHFVVVATDLTEIRSAEKRLQFLAHHDPLTQLPNRLLALERLTQVLLRARRYNERVAVLFLDLDHFKWINDSLGHSVGDQLLQIVSARVKDSLRESDLMARLGGDEFLVILDPIDHLERSAVVARKIATVVNTPVDIEGHAIEISCSMGIATFPEDGGTSDVLIRAADTAMYSAKSKGRNCYEFFTPMMMAKAMRYLALNHELHRGFNAGELRLYYQPQIDMMTRRIVGVEALIRWQHPQKGLLEPKDIIPIAEDSGLIPALGEWVLEQACLQLKKWENNGVGPIRMAVNVSALQILKPHFAALVDGIFKKTGVSPANIEIEVTESALQSDDFSIATLGQLKGLGLNVAIDDFGTGYSCLSSLKLLPIDKLKIDRTFVQGIPTDQNDVAITELIIAIARKLNLSVIAEGVENLEQFDFLREAGCNEVQGYYCSKPLPEAQMLHLLVAQGN